MMILLLFGLLIYGHMAMAGPYLSSAHGDSSYGVNRTATANSGYAQGNCAHCHEMHASIGGSEPAPAGGSASSFCLFADNFNTSKTTGPYIQADDFCFYCHCYTDSTILQTSNFTNYDYSHTFAGYTTSTPASIFAAFNQTGSYHNLYDIQDFAKTNFSSFFKPDSNPCVACHNPHLVKRNKEHVTDPTYTAISRPSAHGELWGDSTGELMSNYTASYQAPYYYSSTSFEPGGTATYNGSTMPDYVSFCTDCHNASNVIHSNELGRNLRTIDWDNEKHGKGPADVSICIDPPYASSYCTSSGLGKVLSCLDCHEPHGSSNMVLIRREVNGSGLSGSVTTISSSGCLTNTDHNKDIGYLCRQCHMDDADYSGNSSYINMWEAVHHCANDFPYKQSGCSNCHGSGGGGNVCKGGGGTTPAINCNCCHYHGASAADRRTF